MKDRIVKELASKSKDIGEMLEWLRGIKKGIRLLDPMRLQNIHNIALLDAFSIEGYCVLLY